jgi:hypothetical protein
LPNRFGIEKSSYPKVNYCSSIQNQLNQPFLDLQKWEPIPEINHEWDCIHPA